MANETPRTELDPNLVVETKLKVTDVVFHDVREAPFDVYGFEPSYNLEKFYRIPEDVAQATSAKVAALQKTTTGGRVRFTTDSEYVAIKAQYSLVRAVPHMPLLGSAGFDLYLIFEDGSSAFYGVFKPPIGMVDGYVSIIHFGSKKVRSIQINFPIYSEVSEFYVGVAEGSTLGEGAKYRFDRPIVFYGSSITHGIAASRPGNCYPAIVSRRLNVDFRNLGFSGNAKAEIPMAEFVASIDTPLFVFDYDHNAPSAEYLRETHYRFYEIYRNARPDTPMIVMSRPSFHFDGRSEAIERREVVFDTYRRAIAAGDKNIYYIDGSTWLGWTERNECTVDGVHPSDLGFSRMADAVTEITHNILFQKDQII